jgi:hypothetical protein
VTRQLPRPPQDHDSREFLRGSTVFAAYGFSASCPPRRNNVVNKGARGTVAGPTVERVDPIFRGTMRLVPVKWADGRSCEVSDGLLILLAPRVTHWEYGDAPFCGTKGGAMAADEADVTCRRCLHKIGIQESV